MAKHQVTGFRTDVGDHYPETLLSTMRPYSVANALAARSLPHGTPHAEVSAAGRVLTHLMEPVEARDVEHPEAYRDLCAALVIRAANALGLEVRGELR